MKNIFIKYMEVPVYLLNQKYYLNGMSEELGLIFSSMIDQLNEEEKSKINPTKVIVGVDMFGNYTELSTNLEIPVIKRNKVCYGMNWDYREIERCRIDQVSPFFTLVEDGEVISRKTAINKLKEQSLEDMANLIYAKKCFEESMNLSLNVDFVNKKYRKLLKNQKVS